MEAEDLKQYLQNLHIEYQFSCYKENNGEGCCLLGEYLQVVKEDYVKSAEAFKKGCDKHNFAKSCFKYGANLFRGRGVKRDHEKALEYQLKACDLGWKEGCLFAGYDLGKKKSNEEIRRSIQLFQKACELKSAEGCDNVSEAYYHSRGPVKQDLEKAFDFAVRACDFGHMQACANVSFMYKAGRGVEPNLAQSEAYKTKALDLRQQLLKTRSLDMEQGISGS